MTEGRLIDQLRHLVNQADQGELEERSLLMRLQTLCAGVQGVPGDPGGGRESSRAEEINRALFRISNAVNTTHDLNDLYASIHAALGRIIEVTNFFIALYDPKKGVLFFPYHTDEMDDDFEEVPVDFERINSLSAQVFIDRKAVLFQKRDLIERKASDRVRGPVPLVWLGVPLMVKNRVIGVMAVQSYTDPERYDAKDAEVLSSVSDQVAVAIERKQAEEALNRSEKRFGCGSFPLTYIFCNFGDI